MTDKRATIQLTSRDDPRKARTIDAGILRDLVREGTRHAQAGAALERDLGNDPDEYLALAVAGAVLLEWLDKMAPASCYAEIHAAIETRHSTPGSLGDY